MAISECPVAKFKAAIPRLIWLNSTSVAKGRTKAAECTWCAKGVRPNNFSWRAKKTGDNVTSMKIWLRCFQNHFRAFFHLRSPSVPPTARFLLLVPVSFPPFPHLLSSLMWSVSFPYPGPLAVLSSASILLNVCRTSLRIRFSPSLTITACRLRLVSASGRESRRSSS
jgi:hypothetical protein